MVPVSRRRWAPIRAQHRRRSLVTIRHVLPCSVRFLERPSTPKRSGSSPVRPAVISKKPPRSTPVQQRRRAHRSKQDLEGMEGLRRRGSHHAERVDRREADRPRSRGGVRRLGGAARPDRCGRRSASPRARGGLTRLVVGQLGIGRVRRRHVARAARGEEALEVRFETRGARLARARWIDGGDARTDVIEAQLSVAPPEPPSEASSGPTSTTVPPQPRRPEASATRRCLRFMRRAPRSPSRTSRE
jgi:hypothetical protein